MEKTKIIQLSKPIESNNGKEVYQEIQLREPALIEVEQFYETDRKSNPLAAISGRHHVLLPLGATGGVAPESVEVGLVGGTGRTD
ncbi:phage tail assembly protein [Xenorhabdus cabanillasii]|uniref:Uncharacterized protein n=1 Tax=Xenorhabdus cabanillasii JM26 TaxID=1427517 RepID=W1IND7_9GAMM|nr:phage tail assembly protein [Xenorhabdus cabanillasii]PHM75332.1 hypothetical protein Xcab_04188 [Xenorhabdus cabanillasii JM26]CDL79997.1 hypothetical protein XCR1_1310010 [Xenorhabdus cabanillasii JM26]